MLGKPGASDVDPKRLREQCEAAARMYDVPWIVDGAWIAVDDLDARTEQARAAGARIIEEPADQSYGYRRYGCVDPQGHEWYFAQPLAKEAANG